MSDLASVQSAADRKTVCDTAVAEQNQQAFLDAEEAAKQAAYQQHWLKVIKAWCNLTETNNPTATQSELTLRINTLVDSAVLNTWETDLAALGYTVTRSGENFTVEIPTV